MMLTYLSHFEEKREQIYKICKNIWLSGIFVVFLQQQIPPRLSTMRTTVGLRFL
jgi:hypothetical protein